MSVLFSFNYFYKSHLEAYSLQSLTPKKIKMDLDQSIQELKQTPGFTDNVGMILVHNGVVRGTSRNDSSQVKQLEVTPDLDKINSIRHEFEAKEGIFKIIVEAKQGTFKPGDDLLYIIVAGDIRENVTAVLNRMLNQIKSEAIHKKEIA